MRKLITRAASGLLFLAVVIGAVLIHPYSFLILFGVICVGSVWEFYRAIDPDHHLQQEYGIIASALIYGFVAFTLLGHLPPVFLWLIPPLLLLPLIFELFRHNTAPLTNISHTLTPLIYATGLIILLLLVAYWGGQYRPYFILGIFSLIWVYDTMAYMVGRFLGNHKLFERISPKKTWEGTMGGAAFTLGAASILAHYLPLLTLVQWLVLALIVVVAGNFGDLVISLIKREYELDDMGQLIPGHGGFLDRFDALFFVMPFVYSYLMVITL